jgi:hypothetical protein
LKTQVLLMTWQSLQEVAAPSAGLHIA